MPANRRKPMRLILALVLPAFLLACSGPANERLVITGSSTVAPLAAEMARRFESLNPGVRVDVQTGGSSRGISDLRKGLADIGMASRSLKDTETELRAHRIAWDGISLIVHKDNPINALSHSQIQKIYRKEIRNWRQLGGIDGPIVVVNKAEGRSTLELFLNYLQISNSQIQADSIIGDNEQGLKTVAGNPLAIGYVSIGAAAFAAQQGGPIKLLPIDGIAASLANVEQGNFPIARPLNLVTPATAGQNNLLAQRFIRFAQSNQVADLVKQQFFIPAHAQP